MPKSKRKSKPAVPQSEGVRLQKEFDSLCTSRKTLCLEAHKLQAAINRQQNATRVFVAAKETQLRDVLDTLSICDGKIARAREALQKHLNFSPGADVAVDSHMR